MDFSLTRLTTASVSVEKTIFCHHEHLADQIRVSIFENVLNFITNTPCMDSGLAVLARNRAFSLVYASLIPKLRIGPLHHRL